MFGGFDQGSDITTPQDVQAKSCTSQSHVQCSIDIRVICEVLKRDKIAGLIIF